MFFLKILLVISVYLFLLNFLKTYMYHLLNVNQDYYNFFFLFSSFKNLLHNFRVSFSKNFSFLPVFYHRNELLWVDGFLFDFLQKKSADIWLRKFVIYTGFIFSERLVFDSVIKIYLDNIIWPLHFVGLFEVENVVEMLSITIFLYFSLFSTLSLIFILF